MTRGSRTKRKRRTRGTTGKHELRCGERGAPRSVLEPAKGFSMARSRATAFFVSAALASCLLFVASARPASAHEFKLESVMNAYVKIEPHEAHLVIRLPLHLARTIRFPSNGA